jgi:opacity protein-like surface antigen
VGLLTARVLVCLGLVLGAPAILWAQERRGPVGNASFTLGASFGDGGTALASTIGLGVGWFSRVGVDVELSHARKLDFTIDLCPSPRVCVIGGQLPVTGRTLSLVPHLTVQLTPASTRVRVYALAGVGLGHIRQRYFLVPSSFDGDRPEFTRSNLTPAVSFGGGATFDVTRRLAAGVDLRSLRLRDDEGELARFITPAGWITTVRVGARIVWRF